MAKALGLLFFISCNQAQQVAVGQGAELFRPVAVGKQKVTGEDARLAVFALQGVERRESHAKAAVQVAQGLKQLGFQLRVFWLRSFG